MQVGMGAWKELQKFKRKRNPEKHSAMEELFLLIWCQGDLFCTNRGGKPQWKPVPNGEYLPRKFARRYTSARVQRGLDSDATPRDAAQSDSEPPSEDFRPPSPGAWALALTPLAARALDEAEQLAMAIVQQMYDDIEREVDEELAPPSATFNSNLDVLRLLEDLYS